MGDRLNGKVAIVTGGGQGIGRGIALAFASEGARIAILDLDATTAASSAEAVRNLARRYCEAVLSGDPDAFAPSSACRSCCPR